MAALAETYVACVTLPATIDGVAAVVMEGGFTPDFDVDEMSNDAGGGHYEDVKCIDKATLSLGLAFKTAIAKVSGLIYMVTINCPAGVAGVPYFSGPVRVKFDAGGIVNVKEGVKIKMTGTSQGAYNYGV